jgi:hypothetical protein
VRGNSGAGMGRVWRNLAFIAASTLALSACSTEGSWGPGFLVARNQAAPDASGHATKDSEKIIKLPASAEDLDCPAVAVAEGGASARVGGSDSQSVRYQFDISDLSRECDPEGPQFALKVGVAGHLLIGPAGSPGSYSTTLHVEVKRDADGKIMFSKSYPVAADTNGGDRGSYNVVTEPILLPLTRARLDADYSISVGLAQGGAVTHQRRPRRQG